MVQTGIYGSVNEVATGELLVRYGEAQLRSSAIGSCVVVTAYSLERCLGGMVHIMLPGRCPDKIRQQENRYATDALENLCKEFDQYGCLHDTLVVCVAGAGNVLKRKDDTICQANQEAVFYELKRLGLQVRVQMVGGEERRSLRLQLPLGIVRCSTGNGPEAIVWTREML